jgi:hypothetical protein
VFSPNARRGSNEILNRSQTSRLCNIAAFFHIDDLDESDWSRPILIKREREKESGNRSLEKEKKGEVQVVLLLFLLVGRNANVVLLSSILV